MDLESVFVVDLEADGLLDTISRIHVVTYAHKVDKEWIIRSTNDYDKMRKFFSDPNKTVVGHNFIGYDKPAIEKVLGIKVESKLIDTLGLSWYLEPKRLIHGLEKYGEDFGVPKPFIDLDEWGGIGKDKEEIIEYYEGR